MNFRETLKSIGIIPVIQINDAEKAVPLALALKKGGLPAAEVTFRTDAAEEAIRRIKIEVPDVCVCAGTVLNVKTAERAVKAGASAIISPGTNPEVVRWCIAHRVPVIPGCATPTEVEACMRMGLDFVKLFPAEVVGGVKMLKALGGPYGNMKFMPTGGISAQNAAEYLALPNVLCCGGSWMVPGKLLDARDFDAIEALAREAAQIENALSCLLHLWVRCGQIPSVSRPYKLPVVLHPFWIGHFRHFLTKGILSHSLPFVKPLFKHFAKKQQKSFCEI